MLSSVVDYVTFSGSNMDQQHGPRQKHRPQMPTWFPSTPRPLTFTCPLVAAWIIDTSMVTCSRIIYIIFIDRFNLTMSCMHIIHLIILLPHTTCCLPHILFHCPAPSRRQIHPFFRRMTFFCFVSHFGLPSICHLDWDYPLKHGGNVGTHWEQWFSFSLNLSVASSLKV